LKKKEDDQKQRKRKLIERKSKNTDSVNDQVNIESVEIKFKEEKTNRKKE